MGVDVSEVMLALAVERARGRANISFKLADATVFEPERPADAVVSRFGVMFFSDPVRSFSNLRRALRPGGRVAFVCWRAPQENPWMSLAVQAALTVLPQPAAPPPEAPGPFSFASRDRVQSILAAADFSDVSIDPFDTDVVLATAAGGLEEATRFSLTLGPTSRLLEGVDDSLRARVEAVVREALRPHVTSAGVMLKGATWLASARRK
jgi:SAM-dependent methyltransferase